MGSDSVLAANVGEEDLPLVVEELLEVLLIGFSDGGKLDRVEAEFLQVHQIKVPAQVRHQVVKSHTGRTKEALIIRADRNLYAMGKQGACRVRSQVVHVAENLVRDEACFNADVLSLHSLHQVRVHGQAKPMTYPLGAEEDSIDDLSVRALVRFTSVQVKLEAVTKLHFDSHDLVKEFVDGRVVVLFIDHIESRNQVGLRVGGDDVVELRLDMPSSEHLEATNNQPHSKKWES